MCRMHQLRSILRISRGVSFMGAMLALGPSPTSFAAPPAACKNPNKMTAEEWRSDLEVLRREMPRAHGNLFHTMTSQQFNAQIDDLESRLPRLSADQVKVELMKLVAMVHDGHTRISLDTIGYHMLPIRMQFFSDGLYVVSGSPPYRDLVSGRVIRIGRLSADEAYQAVRGLVPIDGDNEPRRRVLSADLLVTTEVLHAVGAAADSSSADIVVEKDGKQITMKLPAGDFRPWSNHGGAVDPPGWVDARSSHPGSPPVWLSHRDRRYWDTLLDDGSTFYIQFNEVLDDPAEPIAVFFPAVIKKAEQTKAQRMVLDLRLNGGGDNTLIRPIWHSLLKSERFNQKGKLWVLIGPRTFSAAMNLVDELEQNTNAMFAGEPTGETPNMWGDPTDVLMPDSCIRLRVATLWWQFEDPRDRRSFRAPDLSIPLRFSDYASNRDPVMESIAR